MCTNVTVLYLFSDDRVKVKQCHMTLQSKMTNLEIKIKTVSLQNTTGCWFVRILIEKFTL